MACVGLYQVKPGLLRLDVAPFALLYSVLWAGALAPFLEQPDQGAGGKGAGRGPKGRPEMVRRVEKLVATMFKELDVLLRAEDINRRVMVRTLCGSGWWSSRVG